MPRRSTPRSTRCRAIASSGSGGWARSRGVLLFGVPYRIVAWLPARAGAAKDVRSTYKVLGGIAVHAAWIALLAVAAGRLAGPAAAAATAVGLPLLALLTLAVRDRWEEAGASARAWLLLRRKGGLRTRLLERRRVLAERLEQLRRETEGGQAGRERGTTADAPSAGAAS